MADESRARISAWRRAQGPAETESRRQAALRSAPATRAGMRAKMDRKARAAGFGSMTEAIEATRGLTVRAVAARLGVAQDTVIRWRRL